MASLFETAQQQITAGHYPDSVKTLWKVEKQTREDSTATIDLIGLASAVHSRTTGRTRRDCAVLLGRANATLQRLNVPAPVVRSDKPRDVQVENISVLAGEPSQPYRVLGPIRARVTAATAFSKTPTVEDANLKLREQAARLGANAVINVTYSRGVSATSWKALTAEGMAVVLDRSTEAGPNASPNTPADPIDRIRKLADLLDQGAITDDEYATAKGKLLEDM